MLKIAGQLKAPDHLHFEQFGLVSRVDAVASRQTSVRSDDHKVLASDSDDVAVREERIWLRSMHRRCSVGSIKSSNRSNYRSNNHLPSIIVVRLELGVMLQHSIVRTDLHLVLHDSALHLG